jgi:hypothetical protein
MVERRGRWDAAIQATATGANSVVVEFERIKVRYYREFWKLDRGWRRPMIVEMIAG